MARRGQSMNISDTSEPMVIDGNRGLPMADRTRRSRFVEIGLLVGLLLLAAVVVLAFATAKRALPFPSYNSMGPGQNNPGPAVGSLGGVPVSIPRTFAHFLEYEHDPHWLERKGFEPPARTYNSKINSFGFEVRYPDMAALDPDTEADKKRYTIYDTPWMRVGIDGSATRPEEFLRKMVESIPTKLSHLGPKYRYEVKPEPVYGLVAFAPTGFSEADRAAASPRTHYNDQNIYYHADSHGRIDTYIACSNKGHEAAPCSQLFVLIPQMRVTVDVSYRKGQLIHWREIQDSVSRLILGFQVTPQTINTPR